MVWKVPSGELVEKLRDEDLLRRPEYTADFNGNAPILPEDEFGPDGQWHAYSAGSTIYLQGPPGDEEKLVRQAMSRCDSEWQADEVERHEIAGDWFAAVFHLERLLELQPGDADLLKRRAAVLARAVAADPKDGLALARHARAALAAGDAAAYRKSCTDLAALAADQKDDGLTLAAARVCVLATDAGPDLAPLVAAAEKAGDRCTQAGLLLRMGRAAEAAPLLEESRKDRAVETAHEELLLALAYHQMQKPEDAKRWLERVEVWLDAPRPADAPADEPDLRGRILGSETWLDVQILRREADAVAAGK